MLRRLPTAMLGFASTGSSSSSSSAPSPGFGCAFFFLSSRRSARVSSGCPVPDAAGAASSSSLSSSSLSSSDSSSSESSSSPSAVAWRRRTRLCGAGISQW